MASPAGEKTKILRQIRASKESSPESNNPSEPLLQVLFLISFKIHLPISTEAREIPKNKEEEEIPGSAQPPHLHHPVRGALEKGLRSSHLSGSGELCTDHHGHAGDQQEQKKKAKIWFI